MGDYPTYLLYLFYLKTTKPRLCLEEMNLLRRMRASSPYGASSDTLKPNFVRGKAKQHFGRFRHSFFSISLSQVEACSSFGEAEASFDRYAERPVDEGGGDVDLEVKVRQGSLDIGGAEEFDDGDEGCDGGAFEEVQDFVGHHREGEGESLRKDDVLHGAEGGKAHDFCCFKLPFGDGVEGGVEDFRKVGA